MTPFSHDVPSREPSIRRMAIRARLTQDMYLASDLSGTPQLAWHPGTGRYSPGETPLATWHDPGDVWVLDRREGAEVLVDGRPDKNPPAIGWHMSVAGFGPQFPDAAEAATGFENNMRIVFHPSGRAVLVAPMDSNGDLEIWAWSGAGFGAKYAVASMADAEDDIGAPFEYPRIDQSGNGQYAFSPDGNWLAIAGDAGTTSAGAAMPLVVVPFDLTTGLDLLNPVYPSGDHSAVADANCVAWSPDGNHVGIGTSGSPYIRFWNWTGSAFGAAEADPASPPVDPVSMMDFNTEGTYLVAGKFFSTTAPDFPKAWAWAPGTGWGAALSAPASTQGSGDEAYATQFHPDGEHVLLVGTVHQVCIYDFDPSGSGSWGARTLVDDWNADELSLGGGAWSPDGTMLVVIGNSASANVARLYSFDGSTATFVEEISWTGDNPQTFASVAWRPS